MSGESLFLICLLLVMLGLLLHAYTENMELARKLAKSEATIERVQESVRTREKHAAAWARLYQEQKKVMFKIQAEARRWKNLYLAETVARHKQGKNQRSWVSFYVKAYITERDLLRKSYVVNTHIRTQARLWKHKWLVAEKYYKLLEQDQLLLGKLLIEHGAVRLPIPEQPGHVLSADEEVS